MGHRTGAYSGKASRAGTLDTLARHRKHLLGIREVILKHGLKPLPLHLEAFRKAGLDFETGERTDEDQ